MPATPLSSETPPEPFIVASSSDSGRAIRQDGNRYSAVQQNQSYALSTDGAEVREFPPEELLFPTTKKSRQSLPAQVGPESNFSEFRRLCDELLGLTDRLDDFISNGSIVDEGLEVIVQIEHLSDELFDVALDLGEEFARLVVIIQSQIVNAFWTESHVTLLRDLLPLFRARRVVTEELISTCLSKVEEHGLDPLRGVVSSEGRKRYQIVEADGNAAKQ